MSAAGTSDPRSSRAHGRFSVLPRAAWALLATAGRRRRPADPKRILIAHHLLLGDTLCLAPLLAKCRAYAPHAEIVMTAPRALVPLYQGRPYGVTVLAFDPKDAALTQGVIESGPYDLALVPAENRYAWLALAARAQWIVGFDGDRPGYKNRLLDEAIPFPAWPFNWADTAANLVPGPPPRPYRPSDWPEPPAEPFDLPAQPYAILHVGARNPLKYWPSERWPEIGAWLERRGMQVVWSGGPEDVAVVRAIDPTSARRSYAGRLTLAQLWQLFKHARLMVAPDTGVVHLARLAGVPTVALFGPGTPLLSGAGDYWRESPYQAVTIEDVPCRNQSVAFKRTVPGMRRCVRYIPECTDNVCMKRIGVDLVIAAIERAFGAR